MNNRKLRLCISKPTRSSFALCPSFPKTFVLKITVSPALGTLFSNEYTDLSSFLKWECLSDSYLGYAQSPSAVSSSHHLLSCLCTGNRHFRQKVSKMFAIVSLTCFFDFKKFRVTVSLAHVDPLKLTKASGQTNTKRLSSAVTNFSSPSFAIAWAFPKTLHQVSGKHVSPASLI